jgi:hypothetical protein
MSHGRHENAGFGFWGDAERATPEPANSPHDYRARATRLRALAADSPDPQIRAYLLTTAAQFDRLADYAAASAASTHAA